MMMPIERIPDWEKRLDRQDAFWHNAILDRPVVVMHVPAARPGAANPPEKPYASFRDRWLDTERVAGAAVAGMMNCDYLGDALPIAWPNLGPEVFSAMFGVEMEYTAETSWAIPSIHDWTDVGHLAFSKDNFYWKKLEEMTDALLEAGRGLFYTGMTDWHPGGDALAAFRDPMDLNTDLLFYPDEIKAMLDHVETVFLEAFDYYHAKLTNAGQPVTTWPGIVSRAKWHIPSNDFSCMVSNEMFREFFLPGIIQECRHMEASCYHLDGPDALRHLDTLLEIPELNAIQWVYGAGRGRASDWIPVYKRCQQAGKGIQMWIAADELPCMMENLRPEGVWMNVTVDNHAEAEKVLGDVERWR